MTPQSLSQVLVLYTWFPLAALLFFLLLIARFYQKFSHKRMFFRFFTLPMLLFGAGAVRYASIDRFYGDVVGDILVAAGGITLCVLCVWLYARMMIGLKKHEN